MPRKSYKHLRQHAFDSGMYNLLADLKQNPSLAQGLPQWQSLVTHFGLSLANSNTAVSNREAFFVNFGRQPTSLFSADFRVSQHLSFDRKYLDGLSGDTRKLHYCHLTQEYQDVTNTIRYILHVNFNSLGEVVYTELKDVLTKEKLMEDPVKLAMIIADVSTILSALLALKDEQQRKCELQVNALLHEIANSKDPVKLQHKYQIAVERAQRYADKYLDYSTELVNEFASWELADTPTAETEESVSTNEVKESAVAQTEQASDIETKWQELKSDCEAMKALAIPNYLEFMGLKFALGDLFIAAKAQKSAIASEIKKELAKFVYPEEALQNALMPKNITAKFLQDNYRNIAADIPKAFYSRMIEACIEADNPHVYNKFLQICEFLFNYSHAYREVVANLSTVSEQSRNATGNYTAPAVNLLLQCYTKNNLGAFEMLLRHGVKLGNAGIYIKEDGSGYSIAKHLIELMTKNYLRTEYGPSIPKLKTFIYAMFKPQFKNGFGDETVHSKISLELLRKRLARGISEGRQRTSSPPTVTLSYISVLQYAMRFNFAPDLIKLFATHTNVNEEGFTRLCSAMSALIRRNNFEMIVNDPIIAQNPNAPRVACSDDAGVDAIFETINNIPQNAALNIRYYVSFDEGSDQGILEIIDQLIKQAVQRTSQDEINQFISRYTALISAPLPKNLSVGEYEQYRISSLTATLVLLNLPESRRSPQYYFLLLQFIARGITMTIMECVDSIDPDYPDPHRYFEKLLETSYQDLKDVYEAIVDNGLLAPALALAILKKNQLDLTKFDVEESADIAQLPKARPAA